MNSEDSQKGAYGFTYTDKMSTISRGLLREFAEKGFFNNSKSNQEVLDKLDSRGFKIEGKKSGLVAQLLTKLCQEGLLEREKDAGGNWRYKKI